jgi:murein tripeptide amidase MpaA
MATKKRKLKRNFKFVIFLLIVILFLLLCKTLFNKNKSKQSDNNLVDEQVQQVDYNMVDTSESDKKIIKQTFADGLNVDDYKKIIEQEENYIKKSGKYSKINYNFENKLHYSEIEEYIQQINNSSITNVEIIGKSVDGRNIYGIEIGNGTDVLYIDANVHAAEVANTLILIKFLSELTNEYEIGNEEIINKLNNIKLAVIPCMNPDGYEVYNFGIESLNNKNLWIYQNKDQINFENIKSNANGVDLNRNFPTQNAGMYYTTKDLISTVSLEKTTQGLKYFGGSSLGSEPETKAAIYFMIKHYKNTYAYINMHSQGRVIYAGKPNLSTEFNNLTTAFAKKLSSYNNYTVYGLSSEEVGEGNDGSVTDFMAELANGFKYSTITGRLSTNKYIDPTCNFKYKYPVVTIETITTYTRVPSYFKTEYYNNGLKEMLYSLLNN